MPRAILTAIYVDIEAARDARRSLAEAGISQGAIRMSSPRSDPEAARAETRAHSESPREERGLVMANIGLWAGTVTGGAVGSLLGAIIFGIGLAATAEPPGGTAVFLVACLVGGAAAGSVAGGLLGAFASFSGRRVREEVELTSDVVLHITADDETTAGMARAILHRTPFRHLEESIEQRRAG